MPPVSDVNSSLSSVTQWVGDGNMGRENWGYSGGGGGGNSNGSSGNYSQGKGGGGGGGGSNYAPVNSSNWKSMTRQQQAEWYNGRIQNSGTEFFSHPAGTAFGIIVAGGIMAGTVLALEIPTVITEFVALFRAGQQLKSPYEQAVAEAKNDYPNLANKPDQAHHITPQYLGGPKNGPTAPLNPAYHQRITNAFRNEHPYGQGSINDLNSRLRIMNKVYGQYPLPPGYTYP